MKNLQEFLLKIQTFNWVKKENGQLIDSNGVKLSIKIDYNEILINSKRKMFRFMGSRNRRRIQ
jgi:hypothetical protein